MRGHFADDLTGKRFGNLTVISRAENRHPGGRVVPYWNCRCDCGNQKEVRGCHLKAGKIISCGCVGRRHNIEAKRKHGGRKTRLYGVWQNMKNRCYNNKVRCYPNYGGRGIRVCNEWLNSFEAFQKWAYDNGYDANADFMQCTIDRIDVNGDYCPENCRFVDAKTQANNKRNNKAREVVIGGKEHYAG